MKNSTKVWLFILTTSLFLLILGYNLGDRLGLLIGFLMAIILNVLVFFYGENHLLKSLHAQKLIGQDGWGMIDTVTKICNDLQIPKPTIYLAKHNACSVFSVGHSWKNSSLCVTTGLLENFSGKDLEAIIAHQVCHIRRLDTFSFGVSSTLANAVVGIGQFLDKFWPPNLILKKKQKIFLNLFSPLGWLIIKLVVGQKVFFENDLMASELIQDRTRIGQLLWRLEGLAQTKPLNVPPCTSHLFIVNPEGFEQRNIFLKSHPPIDKRLKKLLGYYPV